MILIAQSRKYNEENRVRLFVTNKFFPMRQRIVPFSAETNGE